MDTVTKYMENNKRAVVKGIMAERNKENTFLVGKAPNDTL